MPEDTTHESDAYWVGALSMALAMAYAALNRSEPTVAITAIEHALTLFSNSTACDAELQQELSQWWQPNREEENDHRDVLRPVRGVGSG